MPKDAISIPVVKNRQMHYEYAITFQNQPFEVRYSVSPMGYTMTEAYTGGKGVTPQIEPKLNNEFGAKILSTTLFKKDVAHAYVMYLSDTKENLMKLMGELIAKTGSFYALKFK